MNSHSTTVGNIMQQIALNETGNQEYANDMLILGYLHDIGKQFGYTSNHAEKGGEILHRSNYKYWQEVYYHGYVNPKYTSPELDLLNSADLQVLQDGTQVTVIQRLEDIKNRYGKNSFEYKNSKELAKTLNLL